MPPSTLYGVRIYVDLYFTGLTFSYVFTKQEKGTVFHSSLQAENYFGQVLFKPEVCKGFVTLFYHLSTSPVPNSVMVSPVEGSTLPSIFLSVLVLQAEVLLAFDVLFLKQVLYIFSTWMRPEIKVSRVLGDVEYPETLFDLFFKKKRVNLSVSSLFIACIVQTVPGTSTDKYPQCFQPSTSQSQPFVQPISMPYIEGSKVDWTVNDSLYHRFLKWKLKCENILDCELAMLPESKSCKKVITWSGDFGMDQYVSWCFPAEDLSLDVTWAKYEDFCKPQTNEVRARFDLLRSFRQDISSVDEWYSAVQAPVSLAKYPQETASILHQDIFWFFLKDEEFVSKTINDSNMDLEKFPASKVRQLAKKMESSKSTARHIKQVASDPKQLR